jgi:hypothetical protein
LVASKNIALLLETEEFDSNDSWKLDRIKILLTDESRVAHNTRLASDHLIKHLDMVILSLGISFS